MKHYSVYVEWGYDKSKKAPYERCVIGPVQDDDFIHDGDNYVSKGGYEGMNFKVCESLEEAIIKAYFNPEHIEFVDLDEEETKLKDRIVAEISKTWNKKGSK